jgi:hypothetical protein
MNDSIVPDNVGDPFKIDANAGINRIVVSIAKNPVYAGQSDRVPLMIAQRYGQSCSIIQLLK